MRSFYRLRIAVKRVLARYRVVIEFCKDCGVEQPLVWTASDDLWDEVTERSLDTVTCGVLCPACFDRRALGQGRLLRWVPVDDLAYRWERERVA